MAPLLGIVLIGGSLAVMAVDVWFLRAKVGPLAFTFVLFATGAVLGIGGLLFLDDVEPVSWVLTPLVMGILSTAHTRSLVAGDGPFRT